MEGKEWRWTQTYAVLKIGNGEERRREEEEKGEGVGLYSPEREQDGKEQRIKRPDWSRAPGQLLPTLFDGSSGPHQNGNVSATTKITTLIIRKPMKLDNFDLQVYSTDNSL